MQVNPIPLKGTINFKIRGNFGTFAGVTNKHYLCRRNTRHKGISFFGRLARQGVARRSFFRKEYKKSTFLSV